MKKKTLKDKKTKKIFNQTKKSLGKDFKGLYEKIWWEHLGEYGKPSKKLTKKQLEVQKKIEKEIKAKQLKEEKRRAKPMKITVGEYEDAIEDAKDYYREDY